MTQSPPFRRFFLSQVCGIELAAGTKIEVEIEPESWADLLVRFANSTCIVEFKLGAPLQAHQDPSAEAFWKEPTGYGWKIEKSFARQKKHFVVFGHRPHLFMPERSKWAFSQAGWESLAVDFRTKFAKSRLLNDLADCLGQLGVWAFSSMKARDLRFASSRDRIAFASMAWKILWDAFTCPDLGFGRIGSSGHVDSDYTSYSNWHFGIEVQASASPSLAHLLRPRSTGPIIWFGYESERRDKVYQSVWFYCESEAIANLVANRIGPTKQASDRLLRRDDERGNSAYLCIRSGVRYGHSDFDWFCHWLIRAHRFAKAMQDDEP